MGLSRLSVAVLRCAECLAEGTGSQLWDYLRSKVCFRPMGYDPILNLLSVEDLAHALFLALCSEAQGIFTIPGKDTLPLSRIAERGGRLSIPVPGPLMRPLYRARRAAIGGEFRYGINRARLHFSGVLDGRRADRELGYRPEHPIRWEELG
jgi:UDP-glucose 4-epimerase